jgi:hypothetical protein
VDTYKNCGNRAPLKIGYEFDDTTLTDKPEDIDAWGYDVETSDFVVRGDPRTEVTDQVYEELEAKISELISNSISFAISSSLKNAVDIRKHKITTNKQLNY